MSTTPLLYTGIRGPVFRIFLRNILKLSTLNEDFYGTLFDDVGMEMYDRAFTHSSFDKKFNYEYLEFLGDTTLNKSIVWYLVGRFPQLKCSEGVVILSRLKIHLVSKKSFASFAKSLSFWDFVSIEQSVRDTQMNKVLEDVFEAFFGATEMLIDERIYPGAGYAICNSIIKSLLDTHDISLHYNDLFDAKTRLKETFDFYKSQIGELKYDTIKQDSVHYTTVLMIYNGKTERIGNGQAFLKADSQQNAAQKALMFLKHQGFEKPIPELYTRFNVTS